MALASRIADDMKAALLSKESGDRFVGETLRNLRAAILNEEVASGKRDTGLDDTEIERVIAREVKKRQESAKLYRENSRDDLAEPEERELEVLSRYLPEQVGEDELRQAIQAIVAETGASGPADMGRVIGAVKAKFGNSADGATVARITKESLSK